MTTRWTAAQLAAIQQKNKTLLLSAAAGSGKTTTLTERIIRSITDRDEPADISKMLIVTFTRASATDLKTKIFNAVSEALSADPKNKHLASQLIKLGSAQISTIDSFYLSAVRKNFSALGISSSFRIADESETVLIAGTVMSEVINSFYDTEEDFSALCECFENIRATEGIIEGVLLDLYRDCERTPEGVEYLRICAEATAEFGDRDFFESEYGKILKVHARICFEDYLRLYEDVMTKMPLEEKLYASYYAAFESDRFLLINALNILEDKAQDCSYGALSDLLAGYAPPALKSIGKSASELSVFCKSLRDTFKEELAQLRDNYFSCAPKDFPAFFSLTSKNLSLLYRVLTEFDSGYKQEKSRRNILELTDIKRLALKLFANADGTPTERAVATAKEYSHIYIDEYQDVDPVQDLIFRSISTPTNRFMVGDIKQSIYSFRGAMPRLFADYRAEFPTHGTPEAENSSTEALFMSENFRCAKPVIDFTNLVCSPIFRACGDNLGYTDEDDLLYAKKLCDGALPDTPVTLAVFAKNSKKSISEDIDISSLPSPAEAEAQYIASEIYRLLTTEKKQDGSPIRPSDIAVLFRNKSTAKRISAALGQYGILTNDNDAVQYFSNPDVLLVLCLLNAIDNPQRDVHLAGTMHSPIFGFTLDDLLLINGYADASHSLYDKVCACAEDIQSELGARCADFCQALEYWRSISVSLPIDKLLSRIFASDTFLASGLYTKKNALGVGGNLKRLYEYARTFEAGSFKGLYNFIEFINSLIENGKTIDARSENSAEGCVTLTTIHKSKGLEFPVCFVAGCASAFNTGSSNPDLTFRYGRGVAMTLPDRTGFAYYTSPLKRVLDLEGEFLSIEEEMRILYVALTRAKERLYVCGSYSQAVMPTVLASSDFYARINSDHFILSACCYMDWLLPVARSTASDCVRVLAYTTDHLPSFGHIQAEEDGKSDDDDAFDNELYTSLAQKLAFKYPYEHCVRIPAKLSVSKLSPDVLDSTDDSLDIFQTEKRISVPAFFGGSAMGSSAAERGTATHLFLQFCDFSLLKKKGVEHSLAYLTEKKFIPESIAAGVYKDELARFADSALIDEILSAKKVIREQRFNILLDASEFTENDETRNALAGEKIAVQGVIDIIVITMDGSIRLYDYKTDRLTREQLADPSAAAKRLNDAHALQLSYYAKAVSQLFGKAPDRVAIYSTHACRTFDVEIKACHDIL